MNGCLMDILLAVSENFPRCLDRVVLSFVWLVISDCKCILFASIWRLCMAGCVGGCAYSVMS